MRIALTGATGGVGMEVIHAAIARGAGVRALVRDVGKAAGLAAAGVELVRGDLDDTRALDEVSRGADAFIHAAAHVGDWGTREEFDRVNVEGSKNAVAAAGRASVRRFVHVSSVAVYGRPEHGTIDEKTPTRPHDSPYESSKLAAEQIVFAHGRTLGLEVSAVRPPVIFGAHDRVFLPRVIRQVKTRTAVLIDGGNAPFNLVAATDVADVILRCAQQREAAFEVFNVAASPVPTMREVLDAVADAIGAPRPRISIPHGPAMQVARLLEATWKLAKAKRPPPVTTFVVSIVTRRAVYDAGKAKRLLGWSGGGDPLEAIRALAKKAISA